jgi:ankyrin repeat protein
MGMFDIIKDKCYTDIIRVNDSRIISYLASKGSTIKFLRINNISDGRYILRNSLINESISLFTAIEASDLPLVKFLVSKGVNLNSTDPLGNTVFHYCVEAGNFDMLNFLIKIARDVNVNAQNFKGCTPLHISCMKCSLSFAELLVSRGADLEVKDKNDQTPLFIAKEYDNEDVAQYLISKGASDYDNGKPLLKKKIRLFIKYCEKGDLDSVKTLFEQIKVFVNLPNCLSIAAQNGYLKVVEYLLAKGVPINENNKDSDSPLLLAGKK